MISYNQFKEIVDFILNYYSYLDMVNSSGLELSDIPAIGGCGYMLSKTLICAMIPGIEESKNNFDALTDFLDEIIYYHNFPIDIDGCQLNDWEDVYEYICG